MKNPQIVDPINITVNNSYNIGDWEKAVIQRCITDNPSSLGPELAKMIGMSERTFYRKLHMYDIPPPRKRGRA